MNRDMNRWLSVPRLLLHACILLLLSENARSTETMEAAFREIDAGKEPLSKAAKEAKQKLKKARYILEHTKRSKEADKVCRMGCMVP